MESMEHFRYSQKRLPPCQLVFSAINPLPVRTSKAAAGFPRARLFGQYSTARATKHSLMPESKTKEEMREGSCFLPSKLCKAHANNQEKKPP